MNLSLPKSMGIQVRKKAALREYTTFRLGGPCPFLLDCETPQQLTQTIRGLAAEHALFLLIGSGSNLLVSDEGLEKIVVRYVSPIPLMAREGRVLEVAGSSLLDDLAAFTVEQGLGGLGFASGIPGTVGGAVAGNAGAFGKQIGDRVQSVLLMDRRGSTHWEFAGNLGFAYRSSRLQESEEAVVSVRLLLEPAEQGALIQERKEILELRRQKHPDWKTVPTAGSFFKNIEPTSAAERRQAAGWFLEQAGAKNLSAGGARVFEKHANIVVAAENCTADDVLELTQLMADVVSQKFGFRLMPEVRILGRFKSDRGVFPIIGK
ncbi:MAG: UDP-N-acetylmuramate dehydrogenase [Lentisphaerota bacterium]